MMLSVTAVNAQEITVDEPEFVNSYCILTSDATSDILPKEVGHIKKRENKIGKLTKWTKNISEMAGVAGALGAATAGSISGIRTGIQVMSTANDVSAVAGAVNGLAGAEGMSIVFDGGKSVYKVADTTGGVRLLVKGENNDNDPQDIYRIVHFKASKKERSIQWMEFSPALLGSSETEKGGYLNFSGHKYGEQSYILTIPETELSKGEYGIFYLSIVTSEYIPVGTFSIQ